MSTEISLKNDYNQYYNNLDISNNELTDKE